MTEMIMILKYEGLPLKYYLYSKLNIHLKELLYAKIVY